MTNTTISSIGAVVALGLTFLKTGNLNIAKTLSAPHTEFLLEGVRPDMLLVRIICYGMCILAPEKIGNPDIKIKKFDFEAAV